MGEKRPREETWPDPEGSAPRPAPLATAPDNSPPPEALDISSWPFSVRCQHRGGHTRGLSAHLWNGIVKEQPILAPWGLGDKLTPSNVSGKERICISRRHKKLGLSPWVDREVPLEKGMAIHSSILA